MAEKTFAERAKELMDKLQEEFNPTDGKVKRALEKADPVSGNSEAHRIRKLHNERAAAGGHTRR